MRDAHTDSDNTSSDSSDNEQQRSAYRLVLVEDIGGALHFKRVALDGQPQQQMVSSMNVGDMMAMPHQAAPASQQQMVSTMNVDFGFSLTQC